MGEKGVLNGHLTRNACTALKKSSFVKKYHTKCSLCASKTYFCHPFDQKSKETIAQMAP